MDVELLSRLQFALTISFHYLFPPLSIGLGLLLVIMEGLYLKTDNPLYHQMARFWVGIFALIFGLGVATGIVMEFEFGTNWAVYSRYVGDVFGSALAAEGLFAFFLESGFLAVLVFGWNKVSKVTHFISTLMVFLGATFSAVWIVVANSWQQTPAGFHVVGRDLGARAEITDFWAMVFNPSSVERLMHTLGGAWAAGAFLALSVGAWYLLKNKHHDFAKATMKIGLCVALFSGFWQLATGHEAAMVVAKHQPAKMAAMEGHYDSSQPAPLSFGGWVDEKNEKTIAPGIPGGTSFLLYGDFSKPMPGLDAFKKEDRPPVNITFQSFHLMVALGMAMLGLSALGLLMWWRGSLWTCRPVLWLFVASVLAPQLANQAGWYTAEVGRQPWVVYNLLRTSDALSEAVTAGHVMSSIIMFSLIYLLLFILFLYLLNEKIQKGPGHYDTLPYHHDNPLAGRGGSDELPATPGV